MKEEMINKNFIYKRGIYCCSKPKVLYEQGKAKVKRRQIRNDKMATLRKIANKSYISLLT